LPSTLFLKSDREILKLIRFHDLVPRQQDVLYTVENVVK
jgi:hypothetical protein